MMFDASRACSEAASLRRRRSADSQPPRWAAGASSHVRQNTEPGSAVCGQRPGWRSAAGPMQRDGMR